MSSTTHRSSTHPDHPEFTRRPMVGITADAGSGKFLVGRGYAERVVQAGGVPLILPCFVERVPEYLTVCDAFLLTGGDDPDMTHWGVAMHPKATAMDPDRQAFELALLAALDQRPQTPVLGVCLGMQLMGLQAGGALEQHLPDVLSTAALHWDRRTHAVSGAIGAGTVNSHHRQALSDPGRLEVIAIAEDGVIEAVRDAGRPFYVGVQWHPERTDDVALGFGLIQKFVDSARRQEG